MTATSRGVANDLVRVSPFPAMYEQTRNYDVHKHSLAWNTVLHVVSTRDGAREMRQETAHASMRDGARGEGVHEKDGA